MIILVWFTIQILRLEEIGSIGALYDIIKSLPPSKYAEGNYKGSRLTMTSKNALLYGIIHIVLVVFFSPFLPPSDRAVLTEE